jgi:acetyl-CoA synthetase
MSMVRTQIDKPTASHRLAPNLIDYDQTRATFSWAEARAELSGLAGGAGLNIAHEAVDRHAAGPLANAVAIRWLGKNGNTIDYSYAQLCKHTNRFANALRRLGVAKGDRVFVLSGRLPELYITALGTLKNRSVFSPLFSAFGPEPIHSRMSKPHAASNRWA